MMSAERDGQLLSEYLGVLTRSLPQLVWTSHDLGSWTWASPRWTEYTGQTAQQSEGHQWLMAVHPEDRDNLINAWRNADRSGVIDVEHRLLSVNNPDQARWFRTHATPLPSVGNDEREWLGTCTDIHEARLHEGQVAALQASSQRQVDDVLTLVRAVTRQSLKPDASAEDYMLHLDSRLEAISRVQIMLRNRDGLAEIAEIVSDALLAHASHESEQVQISGPSLLLRSLAAELFGLAVHELAMNAVEHGALSGRGGRIEIAWFLDNELLRFEWLETEISPASDPESRKGFGAEVIETVLKLKLGATTKLRFEPNGVRCTILLPVRGNVEPGDQHPPN